MPAAVVPPATAAPLRERTLEQPPRPVGSAAAVRRAAAGRPGTSAGMAEAEAEVAMAAAGAANKLAADLRPPVRRLQRQAQLLEFAAE